MQLAKIALFLYTFCMADASVCDYLSSLFNMCLMHGKMPHDSMQTVIVPICNNKNGDISDA